MANSEEREKLRSIYQSTDEDTDKTFIPAKPKIDPYEKSRTFRICAYCRVSTDNDEQLSSYELQLAHYKQLTKDHPNWDLKRIYADEGISGTSLKQRTQFNEMIDACRNGEYDLVVTKSVSRFARNLVDCISIIRELKRLNPPVGVYFETDNLNTLDENKEFMLTFLASFAQEESVKKREAMNWSIQQRFKDGKLLTPALLGYDRPRDVTGRYLKYAPLVVNEEEAKTVRFIFDAYLTGMSQEEIASILTDIGCETKTGGKTWNAGSIAYILTNERYCGNIRTWKTFTVDIYEHKHRKNRQDRDQYLYKARHAGIISVEKFEAVQVLIENRKHHIRGGLPSLNVIDDGIFRGFVPINHHWVNDDPNTYYDISNSVKQTSNSIRISKKTFSAFNLDGYQVVRGQFMQLRYEGPIITITGTHITFNKFCVQRFENVANIQLLLHPAERKMAIRPCSPTAPNNIRWRPDPEKALNSKSLSCQHFDTALYRIMNWNPEYVYKIRGTWVKRGGEQIIVFNLVNATPVMLIQSEDDENKRAKRVSLCPEDWDNDFGEEFYEHTIENDFYYIAPRKEWNSQAASIPAPGIVQFKSATIEELQMDMNALRKGSGTDGTESN